MKDKKNKGNKPVEAVEVICVPVESILDMIEHATVRGMQRGAQMVLDELNQPDPKPDSPWLGDTSSEVADG